MDGENNGNPKPYEQMDDLGGYSIPYFWVDTHVDSSIFSGGSIGVKSLDRIGR